MWSCQELFTLIVLCCLIVPKKLFVCLIITKNSLGFLKSDVKTLFALVCPNRILQIWGSNNFSGTWQRKVDGVYQGEGEKGMGYSHGHFKVSQRKGQ